MPTPKRWPARPLRAARAAPRGRYRRRPRRPEGVAPAAPRGDGLARARYVDALAVVDGRGFVERLEVGFPCHAPGGDQGVDDPRARGKPVDPWMGDRAAHVHDGEWLRRVRRCWRVLDDRHRLSVAAM